MDRQECDEGLQLCRCCQTPLADADHCPLCGCEEFEEREDCAFVR